MRYGIPEPSDGRGEARSALPPPILGLDSGEPQPAPEPRKPDPAPTQQRRRPGTSFFFAGGSDSGF